jgi:hypothetical protein
MVSPSLRFKKSQSTLSPAAVIAPHGAIIERSQQLLTLGRG